MYWENFYNMKNNNGVIIGTFVKKSKILTFLEFLRNKLGINIDKVYVFNVEYNESEYLVTFSSAKNSPLFTQLHDATVLHTKNGCLFSINALNMYIDIKNDKKIPHQEFKVNWDELKDSLLITTNGVLKISKLFKIEDKCILINNNIVN